MISGILTRYKISPTAHRIKVLEIVLRMPAAFSAEEVVAANDHEIPLKKSVVNKILRLFAVRGIIQSVDQRKTMQRGRPELLFKVSPYLLK